jgi:hypothetical protein
MTIEAQAQGTQQPARPHSAERATSGIDAGHPSCVDPYSLLDHRTRGRCLTRRLAPSGRYLEVEHRDQVYVIPLDRPITHIGRGLAADLRVEDPQVSRRHAIIAQRGDGARVLDDRSRNGTFVNGREVTVGYLSDGDVLRLGRVVFRFLEIRPTQKPKPALSLLKMGARQWRDSPADDAA